MTRQPDDMAAQAVLARLGWGADNALTIGDIAEGLNWPRRAVEQAIQQLRLDGKAVASGSAGVWLTTDAMEMWATYSGLRHRVRSQLITANAVRRTARRMRAGTYYQETLFPAA